MSVYILGINSAYHDSSACLIRDGEIVAAAEEERFTRVKHAKAARLDNPDQLPLQSMRFCTERAGITLHDVAYIGFSLNPFKRRKNADFHDETMPNGWGTEEGERTFFEHATRIPHLLRELGFGGKFVWLDHHLCHAASAYATAPRDNVALVTIDGIGETESTLIAYGSRGAISVVESIEYPDSLGFLWEKISCFLGYTEYDACKIMALAAYANSDGKDCFEGVAEIAEDGRFKLNSDVLRFRSEDFSKLEKHLNMPRLIRGQALTVSHFALAKSLQEFTNVATLGIMRRAAKLTGADAVCVAGGVMLNCTSNQYLVKRGPFSEYYFMPAANDSGTAIGAAYQIWASTEKKHTQAFLSPYLGPEYDDKTISEVLQRSNVEYRRCDSIADEAAERLSKGEIVGWFQGRMEFGPRALGNRSILADPRNPEIRERLNRVIKHRETFRPFAASVLSEHMENWFCIDKSTPGLNYMLLAVPIRSEKSHLVPAALHADGTSRIQSVNSKLNPRFHELITKYSERTNIPMLLNTSFNDSEPIVCTPVDALRTFLAGELDALALGNYMISRPTA